MTESHQQETQELEENKENALATVRKTNKKDFLSYGKNKIGLIAMLIHIINPQREHVEN